MITRTPRGRLCFLCDACGTSVTGEGGWLHVDMSAVSAAEQAVSDWKTKHPGPFIEGSALMDYPESVPWKVHHRACDPHGDAHGCYWFYVGRANTWPRLVHWTAHLMGKPWLQLTDWQEALERIGEFA